MTIRSPLSPDVAIERLNAAKDSLFRARPDAVPASRLVLGRVSRSTVVLHASQGMQNRNTWRPYLYGAIVPDGRGCRLVGEYHVHPIALIFSLLWLGGVGCAGFATIRFWVSDAIAGDWSLALRHLGFTGIPVAFVAFFVGLTHLAVRMGRGDREFLHIWLADHLDADRGSAAGADEH